MPRIPVVGTKGLRTAQLSPEVRRIIKRRADRAAQREYAPEIAADKQAVRAVHKGFANERRSIHGATDMASDSLADALRGLKSSGLQGRYLAQASRELAARQGDVEGSIPFLLSDAAQQRNELLTTARQELIDSRAARAKSAAGMFNSALDEERNAASSVLEQRAKQGSEGDDYYDPKALENARHALKDALSTWKDNVPVEIDGEEIPVQEANPLEKISDWRRFAKGLDSEYQGFDMADIMEVIRRTISSKGYVAGSPKGGRRGTLQMIPPRG